MAKRILFYSQGMDVGGMATAFLSLAKALENDGNEIRVILPYECDLRSAVIPRRYILGVAKKHSIRIKGLTRLARYFHILTGWRFYFMSVPRWTHDILIVFRATDFQWVYYTKKPVFGWLHEISPDKKEKIGVLDQCLWRCRFARYQGLIAVSREVACAWHARYRLSTIPEPIPNLIDVELIKRKSIEKVEEKLFLDTEAKVIVCVSRLTEEKGVDRLIFPAKQLLEEGFNFRILIIGDGAMRYNIESSVESLGLTGVISVLGVRANPYPYMRDADLLICPSRKEGMGLVLMESLILGTPVMSTDCGGPRSVLRNGDWGELVENSESGILSGLRTFLEGRRAFDPREGYEAVVSSIREGNDKNYARVKKILGLENGS